MKSEAKVGSKNTKKFFVISKKYKKLEDVLHDLLTAGVPMSEVFPDAFK